MMEFNYLAEKSAIVRESSGRYSIDYTKMPDALASLAKELLEIEATGDRARAENWFNRYDKMPASSGRCSSAADVPVDIDPLVPFHEGVQ